MSGAAPAQLECTGFCAYPGNVAMAGGTPEHGLYAANVIRILGAQLLAKA